MEMPVLCSAGIHGHNPWQGSGLCFGAAIVGGSGNGSGAAVGWARSRGPSHTQERAGGQAVSREAEPCPSKGPGQGCRPHAAGKSSACNAAVGNARSSSRLRLSSNSVGDNGSVALAEALKVNHSLQSLE